MFKFKKKKINEKMLWCVICIPVSGPPLSFLFVSHSFPLLYMKNKKIKINKYPLGGTTSKRVISNPGHSSGLQIHLSSNVFSVMLFLSYTHTLIKRWHTNLFILENSGVTPDSSVSVIFYIQPSNPGTSTANTFLKSTPCLFATLS